MKNKYIVENDCIKISLHRRSKKNLEAIIDLEDFNKVNAFKGTFYSMFEPDIHGYYVGISIYLGKINGKPKYTTPRLGRIILECNDPNRDVDHINGNALDNRKQNLRIVKRKDNLKNRKNANSNNKTGHRNICYYKEQYLVQMQVKGKNTLLGRFANVDEAVDFATEMREKYYGEFSGDD